MLWSKCYCRYDRDYMPTLREQQLASEITCLQKKIRNSHMKPPRHMTTNVLHSMNCANSWHPQILETH
ncbi:unnamed protein product, partial [Rotaria magnacalcarata]